MSGTGSLTAFRYCSYDVPFWARNNTLEGRWHRLGDPPTQYWALCPEAAWAELIRHENLISEAELDEVRMPFWVARVPMAGLVDLRDLGTQEAYGIDEEQMTADRWTATQPLGTEIRRGDRVAGIITPCAALPGHANLTIFGARRAVDWHRKPTLASTLSATRVAIGRPPAGLLASIRRPAGRPERLF